MEKNTKEDAIALLKNKYAELCEELPEQEWRYPRRSDFSQEDVSVIKAFLGPWPRALEQAGIKPLRDGDRIEHNREKRANAKRRIREENKNKIKNKK